MNLFYYSLRVSRRKARPGALVTKVAEEEQGAEEEGQGEEEGRRGEGHARWGLYCHSFN